MSKRGDFESIADIIEAVARIEKYLERTTYKQFFTDLKTQDAVIRNLEVIGEAAKNVSPSLKSHHKNIPWKQLAQVRDKLIHNYFGVNLDVVWGVVEKELEPVARSLRSIIKSLDQRTLGL